MTVTPSLQPPKEANVHPVPFVETRLLDAGSPVALVDHPREFRIVFDRRADADTLAAALTIALRRNLARNHWRRDVSGLWITTS